MTMTPNALPSPSTPDLTDPESARSLLDLVARAEAADGQPPFSDQSLIDLRTGKRQLLVIGGDAAAIVSPTEAEFVVAPDARGHGIGTALLEAIIARSNGGLLIWAHGDHAAARALARSHGLQPVRELLQLRAPVPASVPVPVPASASALASALALAAEPVPGASAGSTSESITTDHFRSGVDDEAWLRLNARVFAHHPEQGAVTRADLAELRSEPWFDEADFLLLRDGDHDGAMVGYCWLKIESASSDQRGGSDQRSGSDQRGGEFYVVGVDPDRQGEGLGRRLMDAGFARLAERGIRTALLYVEADSIPAVRLYRSLGFTDHSIDIQYAVRGSA